MNSIRHAPSRAKQAMPWWGLVLMVLAALPILFGLLVVHLLGVSCPCTNPDTQVDLEQARVKSLHEAVITYRLHTGRLPATLEDLAKKDERGNAVIVELPVDWWGSDYVLHVSPNGRDFEVLSLGPDLEEGTDDDIAAGPQHADAGSRR